MTLRVSGKNLAIGEALRTHVHATIDGVLGKCGVRHRAGGPAGHVTIEPEGSGYRADCTLFLRAGITLQVEALAHDPYASFDKAAERIERRLRDHRKRIQAKHGEGRHGEGRLAHPGQAAAGEAAREAADDAPDDAPDDASGAGEGEAPAAFPAVVAERGHGVAEMTVAAAVRRLDEAACPVVVFRYAENRRINIVYRRPDGNIGWIDPAGLA